MAIAEAVLVLNDSPGPRRRESIAGLSIGLVVVTTFPSAGMQLAGASSFALGCLLSSGVLVVLWTILPSRVPLPSIVRRVAAPSAVIAAVTLTHSAIASVDGMAPFDFGRCFASLAALLFVVLGGGFLDAIIREYSNESVVRALLGPFVLLVVVGVIGAVKSIGNGTDVQGRSVLVFAEPSHFALSFMYVFAPLFALTRGYQRSIVAGIALSLALGLQSLTLAVAVLLLLFVISPWAGLAGAVGVMGASALSGTADYFVSRLSSPLESTNLSTLVWLQGWDTSLALMRDTYGVGIGFQQLGLVPVPGDVTNTIVDVFGDFLNQKDGSFVAGKLIAEYGVLGLASVAGFIVASLRAGKRIRSSARSTCDRVEVRTVLGAAWMLMYAIEMFVRGVGYFSPGAFFVSVAVLGGEAPASSGRSRDAEPRVARERHV